MELPPFASFCSAKSPPRNFNFERNHSASSYSVSSLIGNSSAQLPTFTPSASTELVDSSTDDVMTMKLPEDFGHPEHPEQDQHHPFYYETLPPEHNPNPPDFDPTADHQHQLVPLYEGTQDSEISSTTALTVAIPSAGTNNGGYPSSSAASESELYFINSPRSQSTSEPEDFGGAGSSGNPTGGKVLWNGRGRRILSSSGKAGKAKRRAPNATQRTAANVRERKRMLHLNTAFDSLRECIPTFAYEKHLSRIDTLRLAMGYIRFMRDIIQSPTPDVYARYANAAQEMKAKWSAKV